MVAVFVPCDCILARSITVHRHNDQSQTICQQCPAVLSSCQQFPAVPSQFVHSRTCAGLAASGTSQPFHQLSAMPSRCDQQATSN
eukprot:12899047-Alexandrium_andersonii.AAC.2